MKKVVFIFICLLGLLCVSCASHNERTYQKIVKLIEQGKPEEASNVITTEDITEHDIYHYKDMPTFLAYFSAIDYVNKKHYASAFKSMESVPFSYNGDARNTIVEFKKSILIDVSNMTSQEMIDQINADDKEIYEKTKQEKTELEKMKAQEKN